MFTEWSSLKKSSPFYSSILFPWGRRDHLPDRDHKPEQNVHDGDTDIDQDLSGPMGRPERPLKSYGGEVVVKQPDLTLTLSPTLSLLFSPFPSVFCFISTVSQCEDSLLI